MSFLFFLILIVTNKGTINITKVYIATVKGKGKGKSIPLQAWSGPEGSRQLRFQGYMTTAQDSGKVSPTHRPPLPPGNVPGIHFS